jgi:TonB-dependent SusC/RagA subfamily outer membrane receptor
MNTFVATNYELCAYLYREMFKTVSRGGILCLLVSSLASVPALGQDSVPVQDGTIAGQVTDAGSGEPIPGVNVVVTDVSDQTLGAATNSQGEYEIEDVPAGERTVEAHYVGYEALSKTVEIGPEKTTTLNFELRAGSVDLEEVVVTGAGVSSEKKRLGQSVSSINTEDLDTAPVNTVGEMLQGRIPGLVANSLGEVGASSPIRIRGTVSLTQRNNPLVYVDGVRVISGQERFASVTTSPLDHINPANIERIEVLKGAAAATLYGTEASSGVIQIFTKKGIDSPMQWNIDVTQGVSKIPTSEIPPSVVYDSKSGQMLSESPVPDVVELGHRQEYNLSVRGGNSSYGYYAAGWFRKEEGSLPTNALENFGGRLNMTTRPIDGMEVQLGLNAINNEIQVPFPSWGLMGEFVLIDPRRKDEKRPYGELWHSVPGVLAYDNVKETDRYTMRGEVNYQWADGLSSHFLIGYQSMDTRSQISVPPGPDLRNPNGMRDLTNTEQTETTLELSTAWEEQVLDNLTSTLTIGGQSFFEQGRSHTSGVENFPGRSVSTLRGASTVNNVDEAFQEVINAGFFAQEQLGLNDRLFLTGGLRVDGNSTFGEDFGFQPYPQFGLSWVVSDEPFWGLEAVDVFRLRSAYGTSGLQPGVYDALRTWQVQSLLEDLPAALPQSFGNPDLKPERSREIEVGSNVALLNQKLNLDVTYYWQRTSDAILGRRRPPSSGFLQPQLVNIGELRSQGLEVSADWNVLANSGLGLEVNGTFSTRDQTVADLGGVPGFQTDSKTTRWHQVREGYAPGAFIAPAMDSEDPYELTVPVSELSSLNQIVPNYRRTENGEREEVFMGKQLPDVMGSFGATLTVPQYNLSLSAQLRAEGGFVVFNETDLIRTANRITRTTARMIRDLNDPNTSTERRREIAGNYADIHPQVASNWIEEGDYLRLQELSLDWSPDGIADMLGLRSASVALTGRNLLLLTGYDGIIDPGTSSVAQNDLTANVDYFGAPSPRQFELKIRAGF